CTEARFDGQARSHHLVAIDPSPYLTATLERAAAAEGGAPRAALAEALVAEDPELTLEEAHDFLDELIAPRGLVPALAPAVPGPAQRPDVLRQGRRPGGGPERAFSAGPACGAGAGRAGAGAGAPPGAPLAIQRELLPRPLPAPLARLFQVDMIKPMEE